VHYVKVEVLGLSNGFADALAPVEKAIRLSPRDPDLYVWYFVLCS